MTVALTARANDVASAGRHASTPMLITNERAINDATRRSGELAASDPKTVFAYVLAQLPARVKVYPTENYYYFSFLHDGNSYAGNIRLDVNDRDSGKVHFAYFRPQTPWMGKTAVTHLVFDSSHGIKVEKLEQLKYRVSNATASVVFELNDLSGVLPSPRLILADERFLGPVFDESGVRFFLVFNSRAKVFHYVLDATEQLGDRFVPTGISDRIHVGMRTGFAFYDDHRAPRKILIGVYADNERLNNYFDGPFDQLPDNFIQGDDLKHAILAVAPSLSGRIDRLGYFQGMEARYLIAPYIRYRALADLTVVDRCAAANAARAVAYATCFATGTIDAGQ